MKIHFNAKNIIRKKYRMNYEYDKLVSLFLSFLIFMPTILNFFGGINFVISRTTKTSTFFVYAIFIIIILINSPKIFIRNFKYNITIYLFVISFLLLNFLFFEKTRIYYEINEINILVVLLLYLPLGLASLYIEKWDYFFIYMKYFAIITPLASIIEIEFLKHDHYLNYMNFSQAILPGALVIYYWFRVEKKSLYILPLIMYFYIILMYGSRMSIFSVLIFALLLEIFVFKYSKGKKRFFTIIFIFLVIIISMLSYDYLISIFFKLITKQDLETSRTIQILLNNKLFKSKEREVIYDYARLGLKELGLSMHGIFGDRVVLNEHKANIVYVHNIFYEIWLSFGWIAGTLLIIILIAKILDILFVVNNRQMNVIAAFYVCLIFIRLLVSGSFLLEGQFILMICLLYNKGYSKKRKKTVL